MAAPKPIKEGVPKADAEKLKAKLEAEGAKVELKGTTTWPGRLPSGVRCRPAWASSPNWASHRGPSRQVALCDGWG